MRNRVVRFFSFGCFGAILGDARNLPNGRDEAAFIPHLIRIAFNSARINDFVFVGP
jgi:hypothetical protein